VDESPDIDFLIFEFLLFLNHSARKASEVDNGAKIRTFDSL